LKAALPNFFENGEVTAAEFDALHAGLKRYSMKIYSSLLVEGKKTWANHFLKALARAEVQK
jgi:hypothetical protein